MAQPVELVCPEAVECDGVLYVVGVRGGNYYIRRSGNRGLSWLPFSDGGEEKAVAPASVMQRAALVKLGTQGRPLLACIPDPPNLLIYISWDDGETWTQEGMV